MIMNSQNFFSLLINNTPVEKLRAYLNKSNTFKILFNCFFFHFQKYESYICLKLQIYFIVHIFMSILFHYVETVTYSFTTPFPWDKLLKENFQMYYTFPNRTKFWHPCSTYRNIWIICRTAQKEFWFFSAIESRA